MNKFLPLLLISTPLHASDYFMDNWYNKQQENQDERPQPTYIDRSNNINQSDVNIQNGTNINDLYLRAVDNYNFTNKDDK
jgi:hypothetical protein